MARLYWRVKVNGKWTFVPMKFKDDMHHHDAKEEILDYIALSPECDEE